MPEQPWISYSKHQPLILMKLFRPFLMVVAIFGFVSPAHAYLNCCYLDDNPGTSIDTSGTSAFTASNTSATNDIFATTATGPTSQRNTSDTYITIADYSIDVYQDPQRERWFWDGSSTLIINDTITVDHDDFFGYETDLFHVDVISLDPTSYYAYENYEWGTYYDGNPSDATYFHYVDVGFVNCGP